MPDRPLTIATYAAGASLAAITLVYVFAPTFFLDDDAAHSSRASRKKGIVGLVNPANDCFINSVLQALAGLPELRVYLIREVHRRRLEGEEVYEDLTAALDAQARQKKNGNGSAKQAPEWKLLSLQQGCVTAGLKEVLDSLNERPIYKKTITAQAFIRVLEQSFRTRINRTQQDAQEFLQLVAERLDDEYHAGRRVRRRARRRGRVEESVDGADDGAAGAASESTVGLGLAASPVDSDISRENGMSSTDDAPTPQPNACEGEEVDTDSDFDSEPDEEEAAFPFEGRLESQVECLHCHFKPKPSISNFVSLTLHVPQHRSSTTLNACFDGLLKVEHIEDFVCDYCRLEHAIKVYSLRLARPSLSAKDRSHLEQCKDRLEAALRDDPEKPPPAKEVPLPDVATAPKRPITRHTRLAAFPRLLAIHLSRSVWSSSSSSSKNVAKVAFPETLPLGGLLERKTYRLLSVVTHKGGHNSGHYETFRRQALPPPFSTPTSLGTEGVYSLSNSLSSLRSTPSLSPRLLAREAPASARNIALTSPSTTAATADADADADAQSSTPSTPQTPVPSSPSQLSPSSSASTTTASSQHSSYPPALDHRQASKSHRATQPLRRPSIVPLDAIPAPGLPSPPGAVSTPLLEESANGAVMGSRARKLRRTGQSVERWWRISDDKVRESRTGEVLGMQREVYLLFYEVVD